MARHDRWGKDDILAASETKTYPLVEISGETPLTHRASRFVGTVVSFSEGTSVVLVDRTGKRETFTPDDGAFLHKGIRVALRAPGATSKGRARYTASGSVDVGTITARVAQASRIWVEGIHDAELLEKVWGDDLRIEGIVVEPLHGMDDLVPRVDDFHPGTTRRLGVLLDHMVEGTKEMRIATRAERANVLILGHPYVDIWQAIKPATFGIEAWPDIPRGTPWKEGVIEQLGMDLAPGAFWGRVLDSVSSYRDLEMPLVNAVEQLIDFVMLDQA
ncbi:MAG: DUF3097 domain-containing protein [Actinomycetia bacterium]|nr:DUF3097 domain-containing protein [Actinomycetes bacterium]